MDSITKQKAVEDLRPSFRSGQRRIDHGRKGVDHEQIPREEESTEKKADRHRQAGDAIDAFGGRRAI